jgi:hypothetical protein
VALIDIARKQERQRLVLGALCEVDYDPRD